MTVTKKLTNKDIVQTMSKSMSVEAQEKINAVDVTSSMAGMNGIIDTYPSIANEFISTLTNKVVKSLTYSKMFNNPLKMFHEGMLEYGSSIEQLFVEMAEKKNFGEHFNGSTSEEGDLIKVSENKVKALYVSENYWYKFKSSISYIRLKNAFTSETGLAKLIDDLQNSNLSSAYYEEYKDMIKVLKNVVNKKDLEGNEIPKTIVKQDFKVVPVEDININPRDLSEKIREHSGFMSLPSATYNMVGVTNWTLPEDFVFITTPTYKAKVDVNVLADAFNVDFADLKYRTIIVDSLPTTLNGTVDVVECYGILCDKDLIKSVDTAFLTDTFRNPEQLATNIFTHKKGIMSSCLFANGVAFVKTKTV